MIIKHDNIFYIRDIHEIGGVETYVYELAKKYQDYDIAVVTKNIAPEQLKRLKKFCRVYIHTDEQIECKVIITNWDTSIIKYINDDAKVYTGIHTDYSHSEENAGLPKDNERITYIGITEDSKKKFEDITGIKRTILCRNPLELEEDKPVLTLLSATRLSKIKGGERMLAIANELDRQGIDYIWLLFTTDEYENNPVWKNKNIIHIPNRLDVGKFMRKADWIIQPSECEGDSYTYKEALYRGIPLVVCELPYFKEIGIKDGVNALFLEKDCSNVEKVVSRMVKPLKFEFEPIKDNYDKILAKGKSKYQKELKTMVKVKCINKYFDLELNELKTPDDDPYKVNKIRAEELLSYGDIKLEGGD